MNPHSPFDAKLVLGAPGDWWRSAFGAAYPLAYAHRDDAEAERQVTALLPLLSTLAGDPILDVGCGGGRHLSALRAHGLRVFGLDFSPELLAIANSRTACTGRVVRADMRALPVAGGWGAIALFFTAFGYFDDDTNSRCLDSWVALLRPGGLLLLDVPLPEAIAGSLVAHSERQLSDGSLLIEDRTYDGIRVEKHSLLRGSSGESRWNESVRVYDRAWWRQQAEQRGLQMVPAPHGAAPTGRVVLVMRR